MNGKLMYKAIARFVSGILLLQILLFVPAGTIHFWNAWLLIAVLFIPMLIAGAILLKKKPELLAKRLNTREKESEQRIVIALSALMFIAGFIVASLDHRFGWLQTPVWLSIAATILFLIGYILYAEVLRENAYLSRTVEVQENQKVIETGLYGVVRHPMYLATLLLFLTMPLILGSFCSFVVFLIYPALIVKRILNEEKILMAELTGYSNYKKHVKYRLIPFVW